jgi:hypothetical protein
MGAELAVINNADNVEAYRASTNAAAICKEIVLATSSNIQGKRYVSVEGWQAIAVAHGCAAGARNVERVEGGVRAIGEVRRMQDGTVIATAEGFVGEDEPTWFGGQSRGKTLPKRADYAIRAMAQTRAISRACRSAFAHVVVMMNAGLATTPAEEVPFEGFDRDTGEVFDGERTPVKEPAAREKLDGPHTCKTELRKAINSIIAAVREADSDEKITAILAEHKRTVNQARRDWPALIDGDPNIEEDVGLVGVVANRRLAVADDGMFKMLIDSMKECDTKSMLENWRATNEALIEQLEDAQGRSFELAYALHESGINTMDQVSA